MDEKIKESIGDFILNAVVAAAFAVSGHVYAYLLGDFQTRTFRRVFGQGAQHPGNVAISVSLWRPYATICDEGGTSAPCIKMEKAPRENGYLGLGHWGAHDMCSDKDMISVANVLKAVRYN